jgi:hypothetical protein
VLFTVSYRQRLLKTANSLTDREEDIQKIISFAHPAKNILIYIATIANNALHFEGVICKKL